MSRISMKPTMKGSVIAVMLLTLTWLTPSALAAEKKGKKGAPQAADSSTQSAYKVIDVPNFRDIVFPPAPAITRIRYLDFFSSSLPDDLKAGEKKEVKKAGWMDRLSGVDPNAAEKNKKKPPRFHLYTPNGLAVDSKGMLYVADTNVGAIFIFNTETDDVQLIKHGVDTNMPSIMGLTMDDNDHLFATDNKRHEVLEFDQNHKFVGSFGSTDLNDPSGLAIDHENRLLYVADIGLDQVVVFDADTHALIRKMGTTGKNHTLTDPGNFSKPTNVAVDKDGNLYVSDTLNDRIEVFDADGNFIRTWGKNGDGPGNFERPKGVTVDSDGHVWVADAMQNRLQIFTSEGQLLLGFGGFGIQPAYFAALCNITFDATRNRIFTSEQMYGRVQMFQYYTDDEARAELAKRRAGKSATTNASSTPSGAKTAPAAAPAAASSAPAAAPTTAAPGSSAPPTPAAAASSPAAPAAAPANGQPGPPVDMFKKIREANQPAPTQ